MLDSAEEEIRRQPLWQRWTGTQGLFYQAALVWPIDGDPRSESGEEGSEKPPIEFVSGIPRFVLRNVPVLLPVGAAIYFVSQHLGPNRTPFGTYISPAEVLPGDSIGLTYLPLVLLGLVWVGLILYQFTAVGIVNVRNIHRDLVFFLTVGALGAFSVFSLYLVTNANDPGALQPHVTYDGGYFLFLLVAAHFIYDGLILRAENLFWNLGNAEIIDTKKYEVFRTDLREALNDGYEISVGDRTLRLTRSQLFALLILGPVAPIPVVTIESTLVGDIGYLVQVLTGYFTLVVLFQFIILLRYFNRLLSDTYEVDLNDSGEGDNSMARIQLDYKPFHPDDRGGFRALGNFAMRVNVIFVLAGIYLAYRFYTNGYTALPSGGFESSLGLLNWVVNYPGPIVLYAFVVVIWLYKSFWRMHVKMERGRRQMVMQLQEEEERPQEMVAGQYEALTPDGQAWQGMQNAPVWPINRGSLMVILLIDAIPILYTAFL